jgi:hypothetical protein
MCRKIVSGFIVMLFVSLEPVLGQVDDISYNPPKSKLVSFIAWQKNAEYDWRLVVSHQFHVNDM